MTSSAAITLNSYLKKAGEIPLLTAEEEIDLAKKIEAGLKASTVLALAEEGGRDLPRREIARLRRVEQIGRDAKERFIVSNLRLVVHVAKKRIGQGVALSDLIQEGNIGLIRAVEKFDYTRGNKFSTYANYWIKQAIGRAIADQSRAIRFPVHAHEDMGKLLYAHDRLYLELGREPTSAELAEATDIELKRVLEIQKAPREPMSLDAPIGEEGDASIEDLIEDKSAPSPAAEIEAVELADKVSELLSQFDPRESRVIALRFGLDGGEPKTLKAIGDEFGVSRERVRQIESRTLSKLRNPIRSKELRDYIRG